MNNQSRGFSSLIILLIIGAVILLGAGYVVSKKNLETSETTTSNAESVPSESAIRSGTQISLTLGDGVIGKGIIQDSNSREIPASVRESAFYEGKQVSDIYKVQDINKTILEAQIKLGNHNKARTTNIEDVAGATIYVTCGTDKLMSPGVSTSIPGPFGGTISKRGCNPFSITAKISDDKDIPINDGAYN